MEDAKGSLFLSFPSFFSLFTFFIVFIIVFTPLNRIPFFRLLVSRTGSVDQSSQPQPQRDENCRVRRYHPRSKKKQKAQKKRARKMAEFIDSPVEYNTIPALLPGSGNESGQNCGLKIGEEEFVESGDETMFVEDELTEFKIKPHSVDVDVAAAETKLVEQGPVQAESGTRNAVKTNPVELTGQSAPGGHESEPNRTVNISQPSGDGPVSSVEHPPCENVSAESMSISPSEHSDLGDHDLGGPVSVSTSQPSSKGVVDNTNQSSDDPLAVGSGFFGTGELFKPSEPAAVKPGPIEQCTSQADFGTVNTTTSISNYASGQSGLADVKSKKPDTATTSPSNDVEHAAFDSIPHSSKATYTGVPSVPCESMSVSSGPANTIQSTPDNSASAKPSSADSNAQTRPTRHLSEKLERVNNAQTKATDSEAMKINSSAKFPKPRSEWHVTSQSASPGTSCSRLRKGKHPAVEHESVKYKDKSGSVERVSIKTKTGNFAQVKSSEPSFAKSGLVRPSFQSTPDHPIFWGVRPSSSFQPPVTTRSNRGNRGNHRHLNRNNRPTGNGEKYNRVSGGFTKPTDEAMHHIPVKAEPARTFQINLGDLMTVKPSSPHTGSRPTHNEHVSSRADVRDSDKSEVAYCQPQSAEALSLNARLVNIKSASPAVSGSETLDHNSPSVKYESAKLNKESQNKDELLSPLDTGSDDLSFETLKPSCSSMKIPRITNDVNPEQYVAAPRDTINRTLESSSVFNSQSEEAEALTWHGNILPGPSLSSRWLFQNGLRYIPSNGETNVYRTVKIENLSENTSLSEVLEVVPGTIYSARMFDTTTITGSRTVIVVFVEQKHAFYLIHLAESGLKTGSALARVTLVNTPTYPFSAEVEKWVTKGNTRALVLTSVQASTKADVATHVATLLNGSELASRVKCVTKGPQYGQLTVTFYTIDSAVKACHVFGGAKNERGRNIYTVGFLKQMGHELFVDLAVNQK